MKKFLLVMLAASASFIGLAQSDEEIKKMKSDEAKGLLTKKIQEVGRYQSDLTECERKLEELNQKYNRDVNELNADLKLLNTYVRINGVYWTKNTVSIKEVTKGEAMREAKSLYEWVALTEDGHPCYMEPEYKRSEEPGLIYNYHAIQRIEDWKGIEGLRLPTEKEGRDLVNYLASISNDAPNAGMLLRMDSSLNVKKGGYCYKDSEWESGKTIFWLSSPTSSGVRGLSIGSDNSVGIFERSSLTYGFMVRLVKK
jgi:hypothetical protein